MPQIDGDLGEYPPFFGVHEWGSHIKKPFEFYLFSIESPV